MEILRFSKVERFLKNDARLDECATFRNLSLTLQLILVAIYIYIFFNNQILSSCSTNVRNTKIKIISLRNGT